MNLLRKQTYAPFPLQSCGISIFFILFKKHVRRIRFVNFKLKLKFFFFERLIIENAVFMNSYQK